MFEIKVRIGTPGGGYAQECNETKCLMEKGKLNICQHCPIMLLEKERDKEIKNARDRIMNEFYLYKNIPRPEIKILQERIDRVFDEKPIKGLK